MYSDYFAMRGDPATHPEDGPTVFSTQSSHKLLAAFPHCPPVLALNEILARTGAKPLNFYQYSNPELDTLMSETSKLRERFKIADDASVDTPPRTRPGLEASCRCRGPESCSKPSPRCASRGRSRPAAARSPGRARTTR